MGKVTTVNDILPPVDKKTVAAALSDITTSWRKTTEAILNTADTLYKYQNSQDWSVISEELDKRNIIKISVQKFLIGIAQNPTLMDSGIRDSLPPHYNTLYHMSRIDGDKLRTLLKKGTINPSTLLEDVRKLADKFSPKKKQNSHKVTGQLVSATIRLDFPKGQGSKRQINGIVKLLEENYPEVNIVLK